jgi:hypothetical protein
VAAVTPDSPRKRPYCWVTWVTGSLAGTDRCVWKVWYKAHHRYAKMPDDGGFDLEAWTKAHDRMVQDRAAALRADGWLVRVEDECAFTLEGNLVTLAGKPDLAAMRDDQPSLVVDAKSGSRKPKDVWQVLLYLLALPTTLLRDVPGGVTGAVEYRDGLVPLPERSLIKDPRADLLGERRAAELPVLSDERAHVGDVMRAVGAVAEPVRVPSAAECRFCDVAACPDRVRSTPSHGDPGGLF